MQTGARVCVCVLVRYVLVCMLQTPLLAHDMYNGHAQVSGTHPNLFFDCQARCQRRPSLSGNSARGPSVWLSPPPPPVTHSDMKRQRAPPSARLAASQKTDHVCFAFPLNHMMFRCASILEEHTTPTR